MSDARRFAPAAQRNRGPILAVLARVLPPRGTVIEIAAGTGEHGVYFAPRLPGLTWQPTDRDPDALASIAAWVAHARRPNLRPPLALDVAAEAWPVTAADAVFCANMIHISPWEATLGLVAGAARVLSPGGVLLTYGPYKVGGAHTAPSNAAFDASLRSRDPAWGVRDREAVAEAAAQVGFVHEESVPMPANNQVLVFRRPG